MKMSAFLIVGEYTPFMVVILDQLAPKSNPKLSNNQVLGLSIAMKYILIILYFFVIFEINVPL